MKEDNNQILKILNIWGKKKGIFLGCCLFISIYYLFFKPILKDDYSDLFSKNQINIFIPSFVIIIIFIIWLFTSHRIALFRSGDLRIGLFFNLDDENHEDNLKNILRNIIDEIRESHKNLKITFYPINFRKSKTGIQKYIENNQHIIDSAIYAKINSGNIKSDNGNTESHLVVQFHNVIVFNIKSKLLCEA